MLNLTQDYPLGIQERLKEFAESLNARGVEYVVVGGYASAAHGHPPYTGDIDF